jgi:hypothetical protein
MAKTAKENEEEELAGMHPWIVGYHKRQLEDKVEVLKERVVELENNMGIATLLTLFNGIIMIGLVIGALVTGSIGMSGQMADAIIGFAKQKIGIGGE